MRDAWHGVVRNFYANYRSCFELFGEKPDSQVYIQPGYTTFSQKTAFNQLLGYAPEDRKRSVGEEVEVSATEDEGGYGPMTTDHT